jgi:2-oxoglutarate ferredoxin oxidoreductase subunit beta
MPESNAPAPQQPVYAKEDFVSGQDVRWCPGCGDYAILSVMQRTLAKFAVPREKYVFVSGIGCSSRLPYYMNTYGFHTIHGRAPTIATGLKCANPELVVWVVTGDGDGLSIGGNHLIHAIRRNLDINIVLVNNRIYGLTKGQYSPTSEAGKMTKSSPFGSIDHPINPLCVAIASEATFVARTLDTDPRHMGTIFERALAHRGTAFIEVYQNCLIFNDKTFYPVTGRESRDDRMVYLEDGKPLVFGAQRDRAIRLRGLQPEVVNLADVTPPPDLPAGGGRHDMSDSSNRKSGGGVKESELLIHRENDPEPNYAYFLTQMTYPEMPEPFGVFRYIEKPTYDDRLDAQIREVTKKLGKGTLKDLVYGGEMWTVK